MSDAGRGRFLGLDFARSGPFGCALADWRFVLDLVIRGGMMARFAGGDFGGLKFTDGRGGSLQMHRPFSHLTAAACCKSNLTQ